MSDIFELAEAIIAAATPDDEFHKQKSIRRNAEKLAKQHGYNAKQYEKKSIKAEEAGKERKAEYLYDKANAEWDKETAQQQRGADAHKKVEDLRFGRKSKGMDEALELAEAIINEVSIRRWKEAAANVLPKRMEDAEAAKTSAEKGWEEYDKAARKHPEEEPALYRLAQANDEAAQKAEDTADHAYAVTRLRTNDKANANKAIKAAKKVQDKREDEFGRNPEKRTLLRSGKANQLVDADPVKSRTNEALQLAEAICDFADNLFELDYEQKQDISPNKIKRTKKDKNGEKVDVVSVADELFPYEGTAKQQFNQKILDKINDMIEGTGSLEDLIQFVRAGAKVKKVANEGYEAAEEILETALDAILKSDKSDDEKSRLRSELVKARGKERRLADEKAWKSWAKGDLKNPDVSVIRNPEFTKNANGERKTRLRSFDNHYHPKNGSLKVKPEWKQVTDSIKRHEKKVANEGYEDAIELIESLKSYVLKKFAEEDPKDRKLGDKRLRQYDKACDLAAKAYSQVVDNAGGLKKLIDSKRDTTKNKEGEMDTDWRRSAVDQMRVDVNRANDPNNERAIANSIRKHNEKEANKK